MPEPAPRHNVLFLCTGNSDRSILAEAILARDGDGRFRAFSAGSYPQPLAPEALALLAAEGHDTTGCRSKSWDEFTRPDAAPMDFVLTLCDDLQSEGCPHWPGQPSVAHWSIPNPCAVSGRRERELAFAETYRALRERIRAFIATPVVRLDAVALKFQLVDGERRG
ncbi:MAG: arsenate reductase ArsC [Bauldia sp.]|nr:arsenate reductase ArsC [Bauldia sp.]